MIEVNELSIEINETISQTIVENELSSTIIEVGSIDLIEVTSPQKIELTTVTEQGLPGNSAYEIALSNGFIGTESEWLESLKGEPGDGDKSFIHNQIVAATEWNINHNLNKFPSITIVDSSNEVVIGDILFIDMNNIRLSFSAAFGGKVYMN